MIDDIVFGGTYSIDTNEFIMEIPSISGGDIISYSLDGGNYDFINSGESISIIIN